MRAHYAGMPKQAVLLATILCACSSTGADGMPGPPSGPPRLPISGDVLDVVWTRPSVCTDTVDSPCPYLSYTTRATVSVFQFEWSDSTEYSHTNSVTDQYSPSTNQLLFDVRRELNGSIREMSVLDVGSDSIGGDMTWTLPGSQVPTKFHVEMIYADAR